MASSQDQVERSDLQLKRLGFVRVLSTNAVVSASNLYNNAKQSSGSLKSALDSVENAVTTVVSPVYQKIQGFPDDLLLFLDNKVDEGAQKFHEHTPPIAKTILSKAQLLAKKASEVAQHLAEEAMVSGPFAVIYCAGALFKNIGIGQLASLWQKAINLPTLLGVTKMAVPTAAYWSEKYNNLVKDMAGKGFHFFNYAPLVPVEEMAEAHKQVETDAPAGKDGDMTGTGTTHSDS